MVTFAQRFKHQRENVKKWTQDQTAEALGVSRSTIAGYESEEKNRIPREETLNKIADLFGVSIDYLLGRSDEQIPLINKNNLFTDDELNDPEFSAFFKEYKDAPEQRRRELRQFWEFLKQQEQGRKPGDKQGE